MLTLMRAQQRRYCMMIVLQRRSLVFSINLVSVPVSHAAASRRGSLDAKHLLNALWLIHRNVSYMSM